MTKIQMNETLVTVFFDDGTTEKMTVDEAINMIFDCDQMAEERMDLIDKRIDRLEGMVKRKA